jgi:hypothetical protein
MDGGLVVAAAWCDTNCRPRLEHPITSPRKTGRNGDAKSQSTGARDDARESNNLVVRLVVIWFPTPGSSGLRVWPLLLPLLNKRTNWQGERNNFFCKRALRFGEHQVNLGNADEARLAQRKGGQTRPDQSLRKEPAAPGIVPSDAMLPQQPVHPQPFGPVPRRPPCGAALPGV